MYFDCAQYKQKGFTLILVLVGILVIIVVASGAYYLGKSQTPPSQKSSVFQETPKPSSPPSKYIAPMITENNETLTPEVAARIESLDETANWETYTDPLHTFSIKYPRDWKISNSCSLLAAEKSVCIVSANFKKDSYYNLIKEGGLIAIETREDANGGVGKTIGDFCKAGGNSFYVCHELRGGGWSGVIRESGPGYQDVGVRRTGDEKISISIKLYDNPNSSELASLYNKILSTFKFTP